MNRLFVDTSYAVAMLVKADVHHELAVQTAHAVRKNGTSLITTRAVLLEIGNSLSRSRHRRAAVELLDYMESDELLQIQPITLDIYSRALAMYRQYEDKEWGLVDCCSFVVMRDCGIRDALTTDIHFEQAGFIALLR